MSGPMSEPVSGPADAPVDEGAGAPAGGTGSASGAIRVLIVDDDALVRAGLTLMLRGAPALQVVGAVADGAQVQAAVGEHSPDVVLMDIRMAGLDGIDATRRLRARRDAPEVIILTTFDADEHVFRALRAGASGFLLKDTPPEGIVEAIRRVAAGEPSLSPSVTRRLIAHLLPEEDDRRRADARRVLSALSDREREVALAVGQGKANAVIAGELHMSVGTVKGYISRILTKAGLDNRVQLALVVHDAS
ncbi:response regulator transcription factor [Nonomuraea sp. 3-1Str]|uniref:response regulator transcription factor n=1 Tax=Nonomuraea sp. 3-1Str TaxID=2929801 RepID=UPI002870267C|nr:response regulator transcription factor [Nonomuraea sp. 3-1Str]